MIPFKYLIYPEILIGGKYHIIFGECIVTDNLVSQKLGPGYVTGICKVMSKSGSQLLFTTSYILV